MFDKTGDYLSKNEMRKELQTADSKCIIHLTEPEFMVYNVNQQKAWCPTCGMPPHPLPEFMKEND